MKRDYKLFLQDIIDACHHIQKFVENVDFEQFLNDDKTSSAVIRKFEVIGEAAKNIPEFIAEKYPEIEWKDMAGMRDRLIHTYWGADVQIIWATINEILPSVYQEIKVIISAYKEKNV